VRLPEVGVQYLFPYPTLAGEFLVVTLNEAVGMLNSLKYQRAVWYEVVNFLTKFVDDDVRAADSCVQDEEAGSVPQAVVLEIVNSIKSAQINPLSTEIESMENIQLEVENGTVRQEVRKVIRPKIGPQVVRRQKPVSQETPGSQDGGGEREAG
jgi:hypothetical protein